MKDYSTSIAGGAVIHRMVVNRFRGLKRLDWRPKPGLNVILGGGDSGKTTILDAVALLLNPTNITQLSDADYWGGRTVSSEFFIGAVISLPPSSGVDGQRAMVWPWRWDGQDAQPPLISEDGSEPIDQGTPVYKICVSGNADLDLTYELRCPNGDIDRFSPTLRRQIGLVRLSGNDRDLRLVQGSALDRLLADPSLRARLSGHFAGEDVRERLSDDGLKALLDLDNRFKERALPHDLGLGLNSNQGQSISAFIGLTANAGVANLPLASWGAGTRRLASLAIAQACRTGCPITLVDEAERGLEPYRQRKLVADLAANGSQVFMTTHSATALSAAEGATLWHLSGEITALDTPKVRLQQREDPETFLSRLAVVGEGATEVGFLRKVLPQELKIDLLDHGVWLCDGRGNNFTLDLLTEMVTAGFNVAGLVDDEGTKTGLWKKLKTDMGDRLLQWPARGCTESMVIGAIGPENLEALIADPDGIQTQARLNSIIDRILHENPNATFERRDFAAVRQAAGDHLQRYIIEAASADPKDLKAEEAKAWRKHGKFWFKSLGGGQELATKAYSLGAMSTLDAYLRPLLEAIRIACSPTSPASASPARAIGADEPRSLEAM